MKKTREQMMDEVIKKFGFEHEMTIKFCQLCEMEGIWDATVEVGFNYVMEQYEKMFEENE